MLSCEPIEIYFSVNGGSSVVVQQPSTYSGQVTLSVPVLVHLNSGSNTVTFGAGQSSECVVQDKCTRAHPTVADYAGDLDKIIVYPAA